MKANYHTHTRWCRHGSGEIGDYVREAIRLGFQEIAVTEHVPHRDNIDQKRMQWEEFPAYDRDFERVIASYGSQIRILKGFECEYYPEELPWYEKAQKEYGYELLILGQHRCGKNREYDQFRRDKQPFVCKQYADEVCEGLETGLFTFLAHPDLGIYRYHEDRWDDFCEEIMRQIFTCCEKNHIPVEINGNGYRDHRRYPDMQAFALSKEYQLEYLINSDAHEVQYLGHPSLAELESRVREMGIQVTELLPEHYYRKRN